jgi:hypothetical protein
LLTWGRLRLPATPRSTSNWADRFRCHRRAPVGVQAELVTVDAVAGRVSNDRSVDGQPSHIQAIRISPPIIPTLRIRYRRPSDARCVLPRVHDDPLRFAWL